MEKNLKNTGYLIDQTNYSDYYTYQNSGYIVNDPSFLFAISKNNQVDVVHGKLNNSTEALFSLLKENYDKERFYVTAIKNLIKQKRYLNLIYELTNNIIDEDEFDDELTKNESNYLIKANENIDSSDKIRNLLNILKSLDEDLSEDDLVEIFSISDSCVFKELALQCNQKQIENEVCT